MSEGHLSEQRAERLGGIHPLRERLGPVEAKHTTRARMRITLIAEEGFDASGFVAEGQLATLRCRREEVRQVRRVMSGLIGDDGQRGALLLQLDDTDGLSASKE